MQAKARVVGIIVAVIMGGAGCVSDSTQMPASNSNQSVTAPTESTPNQRGGGNSNQRNNTGAESNELENNPEDTSENDQYLKPNPRLNEAEKLFNNYRQRMGKATIAADPKVRPLYDRHDWAKYEPKAVAMYDAGIAAAAALLEATEAHEQRQNNEEIKVSAALSAMGAYLESIVVFEQHWAVSGL